MTTELERYKEALAGARHALGMIERNPQVLAHVDYLASVQKELDAILNPPPEMEEVEVEAWACKACDTLRDTKEPITGKPCCWLDENYVKLTGTFQRPKPQKLERSESVQVWWDTVQGEGGCSFYYPISDNFAFDWSKFEGKTGTLTFTWQEDA